METFHSILAHLWAILSIEEKIDKKGKPFKSIRFSKERQNYYHWIKTLVIYEDTRKGIVTILINAGGIRYATNKPFPYSKSYTLKKVKNGQDYAAYSGGKWLGLVSQCEVQKIIDVKVGQPPTESVTSEYKTPHDDDEYF